MKILRNTDCGHLGRINRRVVSAVVFVVALISSIRPLCIRAEIVAAGTDTVMASVLVAAPGSLIHQAGGHAAIRLRCPAYGLDNVFSFENNDAGGTVGHLFGQVKGRFNALRFDEYIRIFSNEYREVKEYPLNLTDMQIRRLWQDLDVSVALGVESNFNIRWVNCNSRVMDKIVRALGDEVIVMHENLYTPMDNATMVKAVRNEHHPWTTMIFVAGLGADADKTDSWRTRMVPATMDDYFIDAVIESRDDRARPLLADEPRVVSVGAKAPEPTPFTPVRVALLVLFFAICVSIADIIGWHPRAVRVVDIAFLTAETVIAVALMLLAVIPASVSAEWNWLFIPLNLLPVTIITFVHHPKIKRIVFIVYGMACALFTLTPLLTSQADIWSSLLSAAIALRVLSHFR